MNYRTLAKNGDAMRTEDDEETAHKVRMRSVLTQCIDAIDTLDTDDHDVIVITLAAYFSVTLPAAVEQDDE